MRGVIQVGDATSHGGKVLTGTADSKVMDCPVAWVGDERECPIDGHNHCVIVEGNPNFIVDEKAVALDGHKTCCGAVLISRLSTEIKPHEWCRGGCSE
ncbi:PAAR domain-containing protein (plasmid) [Robbsia andropogonis]|uniref:PAAR domain-containing protein n=1 Tax=Robbsia andropogonis TaxID=28092 RepID=UPI003D21A624